MIKLKGKTLIITGKEEKMLKRYAKEAKVTPKKFLSDSLKLMMKNITFFEGDIIMEKIK